jgi:hypothetical protein
MTALPGYELDAPLAQEWTNAAYDAIRAGTIEATATVQRDIAVLVLDGPCPRCAHRIHATKIETLVTPKAGRNIMEAVRDDADTSDLNYSTQVISCDCGEKHPGGPEGAIGCGVSFTVKVPRQVVE